MRNKLIMVFVGVWWAAASIEVRAELTDEIQVYTDDINATHEMGIEVHFNTTPEGRALGYAGEVTPHHGVRLTPEFSFGVNDHWELGAYVPMVRDADGNYYMAGFKGRVKWLPVQQATHHGAGWYGGLNVELANVGKKFEQVAWSSEFRFIGGYRTDNWLFGFNPIFGKDLSNGAAGDAPGFELGLKVARHVTPTLMVGLEQYTDFGATDHFNAFDEQARSLFMVVDFDNEIVPFNIGVGRGLTSAADAWTVKAILEIELR